MKDPSPEKQQRWIEFVQSISPGISPQAVRIMGQWRRVSHAVQQIGQASLANSGLTEAQYLVLMSLYINEEIEGRGEMNPSEISQWRGTSRNTTSALIRGLEDAGYVQRRLDEQDRRKFNIALTETGRAKVSQYAHMQFEIVGGCYNALSDAEQAQLGSLLAQLSQNLEEARQQLQK